MNWVERAITFDCAQEALVGILSLPRQAEDDPADVPQKETVVTGIVVIVGGPQYRAGSHRQFTLLARHLAEAGYAVLRFDYRGMGDSTGAARNFETVNDDVAAAIGALVKEQPSVRRVLLWGLCDGASAALLYLHATRDPRVQGVCMANPWVRTESGLARTHMKYYYLRRLGERDFWRKALRGELSALAARDFWRNLVISYGRSSRVGGSGDTAPAGTGSFQERMARAAEQFDGYLLLVLSSRDLTAKEFMEHVRESVVWKQVLRRGNRCSMLEFADADHTFSSSRDFSEMRLATLRWLDRQGTEKTAVP